MDYDPKIFPIGMFDSHIVPFGGSSSIQRNNRQPFIRENIKLYIKKPSVRPEVNDKSHKPFGFSPQKMTIGE